MSLNRQADGANRTSRDSRPKSRIGHWLRVAVMFMSGGFIFPHAMTEDEDFAKSDTEKEPKREKT